MKEKKEEQLEDDFEEEFEVETDEEQPPKKQVTKEQVTKEFTDGVLFNNGINLYRTVETNENFFIGKQWEGVKSNGLPTPVFNFIKQVVMFSVANVSCDNLKLNATPLASTHQAGAETLEVLSSILNDQFAQLMEFNRSGSLVREFSRNAAVDGSGCTYTYWDDTIETGQAAKGGIRTEVLMNTRVIFGNPNDREVQTQPYIIIERRMMVEEAKRRAKMFGASEYEVDAITPDSKSSGEDTRMDTLGGDKVTVRLRLWRDEDTETIHGYESTTQADIRPDWDLGIKRYPITWMCWDYVQDCYHGQAQVTGLIPNQVFVNKMFAMAMMSNMTLAYPKIMFDKTKLPSGWSNRIGAQIAVNGPVENVAKIMDPAAISPQISQFIDSTISYTKSFLGATDVALGDSRADNTSAIVALQRASSVPMEITSQNVLQSVEDLGLIYMDFMATNYGQRYVEIDLPEGENQRGAILYDFAGLRNIPLSIKLDVGASSYWSEITSTQTLDNLLMQGKIDTIEYLKRLPSGQIIDREGLVKTMEQQQAMEMAMSGMVTPQQGGGGNQSSGGSVVQGKTDTPVTSGYSNLQRAINTTGQVPA